MPRGRIFLTENLTPGEKDLGTAQRLPKIMPRTIAIMTGSNVGRALIWKGQTLSAASHIEDIPKAKQRRMPQIGEATTGLDIGREYSSGIPSMQCRYSAQAYSGFGIVGLESI